MSSNINDGVETGNLASSSIADNVNNSGTTQDFSNLDSLSNYLKSSAGTRQGRSIPPLDEWHPEQVADMDLVIKANGEWWHEGGLVTRQSLVSLFATILWKEESNGTCEYFLKTPVQKLRIQVEDVPLLINDVGIFTENGVSWLEFTTTTGDVVRLDNEHPIELRSYKPTVAQEDIAKEQVRPYMLVRNDLTALIGRNTFYHLTEIGKLTEQNDEVILILESGGKSYQLLMPDS
ncbi:DUF1285 domain-containing protein [Psychrobacter sp. ASPA161_9]|uniref:DUF1285 domain-containing protein n=1 Tax=Psychrobacter sp. ASPA161_9 TaxID=3160961 RepID=UPI003F7FAD09